MKYAYYPGCTATQTSVEYDESVRETAQSLGMELAEIVDWTCCGAGSGHVVNRELALALPCQNIVRANELSLGIMTPCPACSLRHQAAEYRLKRDPAVQARIERYLGATIDITRKSKHFLEVLYKDVGIEAIGKRVERPLKGLKVVAYYGCYLVRPPEVTEFDDADNPVAMDEIMKAIGAEVFDWSSKIDCCGGSASIPVPEVVRKLSGKIIESAREVDAGAIVTACPMCHANLDMFQERNRDLAPMPILYFSELTALAFGSRRVQEYTAKHMVDPSPLLVTLKLV